MSLLGFNSYTRSKKPNNLLGFVENRKDAPETDKLLYRFKEHTFGAVGTTSPGIGPNYGNCVYTYNPAVIGAMSHGTGINSTISGYTNGVVPGTDSYDVYSFNLSDAYTPTLDFIFSKDTAIDSFSIVVKNLTLPSPLPSPPYFGEITIKNKSTGETLISQNPEGSGYGPGPFEWGINNFSPIILKKDIVYRIYIRKAQDWYIRGYGKKDSTLIGDTVTTPTGLLITNTYNSASGGGTFMPVIWAFGIPEIENDSRLNWVGNPGLFSVPRSGYQLWTVPKTGIYRITAAGGQGGNAMSQANLAYGGFGASITADFALGINQKIWICVGQRGKSYDTTIGGNRARGGGGSYVVLSDPYNPTDHTSLNTIPLLITAGGNGAGYNTGNGGTAAGGSAQNGLIDMGFSAAYVGSTWNSSFSIGQAQFRGDLSAGENHTFGGGVYSVSTSLCEGTGGGYTRDVSGPNTVFGTQLQASKSFVSSLARNIVRTDAIQQGHGFIKVEYLY